MQENIVRLGERSDCSNSLQLSNCATSCHPRLTLFFFVAGPDDRNVDETTFVFFAVFVGFDGSPFSAEKVLSRILVLSWNAEVPWVGFIYWF